jgi:hypothetical protein
MGAGESTTAAVSTVPSLVQNVVNEIVESVFRILRMFMPASRDEGEESLDSL